MIAPLLGQRQVDAPLPREHQVDAPFCASTRWTRSSCGERQVDTLYACGPNGMLAALEQLALQAGVPAQLSWEAHMRCGIGVCGSCEHGDGLLVCRDGPVLPAGARGCRHREEAA